MKCWTSCLLRANAAVDKYGIRISWRELSESSLRRFGLILSRQIPVQILA